MKQALVVSAVLAGFCVFSAAAKTPVQALKSVQSVSNPAEGAINPTSVELQPGVKTFTVRLRSNKTTGFSWFLQNYSHELIEPVSYRYETPAVGMMGAPGLSVWTFRLRSVKKHQVPAIAAITWRYLRPWAFDESAKAHTVHVFIPGS